MDRRRQRPGAVAGAVVLAATAFAAAAAGELSLKAMLWAPRGADVAGIFGSAPTECLKTPGEPARALSVEIGRAAFRTPVLLGGQAARAGLTCESCHREGRGNPDFQFPGASGDPGTADVTLSLFSSHRGNGVSDPKPIPDLSGPRDRLKVAPDDLPRFIRGLIVEEFDGHEPPPAVLAGLADYVRTLSPAACPAAARTPITAGGLFADARRALVAADASLASGDRPTALLMIAAARARLGLIDERYAGLAHEQRLLRRADADLASVQAAIRTNRPAAMTELRHWTITSARLAAKVSARESLSLFSPARLAQTTPRRLLPKPS